MTSLFLSAKFISHLNEIISIPLYLAKYILNEWYKMLTRQPNRYINNQIITILRNEGSKVNPQQLTSTLQYLFRVAKKQNLSMKQVNVLIKQNTILADQYTEFIVYLYNLFLEPPLPNRIEGGDITTFNWSAISLKQSNTGQIHNRLYMKVELSHSKGGYQKTKNLTMSLLQFKLLCQEIGKIETLIV